MVAVSLRAGLLLHSGLVCCWDATWCEHLKNELRHKTALQVPIVMQPGFIMTGLGLLLAFSTLPALARAQDADASRLMLRIGGGGGYTFMQSMGDHGENMPSANGYTGAWDAAVGLSLKPWLQLHVTGFGVVAPHARVKTEYDRATGTLWSQAIGAGVTFRAPWGGFVSPSLGVALIDADNMPSKQWGGALELVTGWDAKISKTLRLGLALQIVAQGDEGAFQEVAVLNSWGAGGAAGLVTLSYAAALVGGNGSPTKPRPRTLRSVRRGGWRRRCASGRQQARRASTAAV